MLAETSHVKESFTCCDMPDSLLKIHLHCSIVDGIKIYRKLEKRVLSFNFIGTQSGQMSGEGKAGPPGAGPRGGFPMGGRGRGRFPGPPGPGGDRFPGPVGPGGPPPHFPG